MRESSDCLDEDAVASFLDGALDDDEQNALESHLDACTACRRHLADLARISTDRGGDDDDGEAGRVVGRYVLLRPLGAGGMGVVWLAYDPELDRQIALKLLRAEPTEAAAGELQLRLRREAQAMARLEHPHVVAVYDVGEALGRVFISMTYLDGGTLRDQIALGTARWRELLELCVRAGKGLAAAHAAGLIHRDFKPDNVLCGRDGRVVVADFGLARSFVAGEDQALASPTFKPPSPSSAQVTETGSRLGTPRYMAPEQLRGAAVDERADQWSFAVTVYEVIYGAHPFAGTDIVQLVAAVTTGRVQPAPPRSRVPARVRRALLRAMAVDPAMRHASMADLLAALARDLPAMRRRRVRAALLGVAGVAVIAAGLVAYDRVIVEPRARAQTCAGATARLDGIWDDAQRRRAHEAFAATALPYVEASWRSVDRLIGAYRAAWIATSEQSCRAARVHHEISEETADRQVACLDRRRGELQSLTELLATADGALVERSVAAAGSLPAVDGCRDLTRLTAIPPPPSDPAVRQRIDVAHQRLAKALALMRTSRFADAQAILAPLIAEAGVIGYRPLEAEVRFASGKVQDSLGDAPLAETRLREALWLAEASHDDVLAAEALHALVFEVGHRQVRLADAHELLHRAEAAVERAGRPEDLQSTLWRRRAGLAIDEGNPADAVTAYDAALAILRRRLGNDDPLLASVLAAQGTAYEALDRYDEAHARYIEALRIQRQTIGDDHPETATTLENLGIVAGYRDRTDEALDYHGRALAIRQRVLGEIHPQVAESLEEIALVHQQRHETAAALDAHRRAIAMAETTLGVTHVTTARYLGNLAILLRSLDQFDEAAQLQTRVLAIEEKTYGPDHPSVAVTRMNLGVALHHLGKDREALALHLRALAVFEAGSGSTSRAALALVNACIAAGALGDPRGAVAYAERAVAIDESTLDPESSATAEPLLCGGEALLALREAPRALPGLVRALALLEADPSNEAVDLAEPRFALARALWEVGTDRARARALALAARNGFGAAGGTHRAELAAVEQWLRERGELPR